jgi:hypothetical protein
MVAFGEWSFGEWSPPEIGRSEIGRSENGRSENGRSENGRVPLNFYEEADSWQLNFVRHSACRKLQN